MRTYLTPSLSLDIIIYYVFPDCGDGGVEVVDEGAQIERRAAEVPGIQLCVQNFSRNFVVNFKNCGLFEQNFFTIFRRKKNFFLHKILHHEKLTMCWMPYLWSGSFQDSRRHLDTQGSPYRPQRVRG